ncbi:MAG TPA: class III signal peptide-containing protein [bacterium]|nr:class III signal peptide-containing protein [bacterium]
MALITFLQAWLVSWLHREERGQGSIEYVLLILAVVLFLIAAAFLLRDVLVSAVNSIQSWVNTLSAP